MSVNLAGSDSGRGRDPVLLGEPLQQLDLMARRGAIERHRRAARRLLGMSRNDD